MRGLTVSHQFLSAVYCLRLTPPCGIVFYSQRLSEVSSREVVIVSRVSDGGLRVSANFQDVGTAWKVLYPIRVWG